MELTHEALEHHWLPFTNNREFKRTPRLLVRASGMYYWNQAGQRILDGSSGLFTSAAGHCRPEIALAVSRQLQELDCTIAQGYHLTRPVPPEALRDWLRRYEAAPAESRITARF